MVASELNTKVKQMIDHSLLNGRVFSSYIFVGNDRKNKIVMSKYFASALNCLKENSPCGICANCKAISDDKFHSYKILSRENDSDENSEKKKSISIGDIRNLRAEILSRAYQGYLFVYIERAEDLTSVALNGLLKILEDIPENVVFIFDVANQYSLLPTIRSRSQSIIFNSVQNEIFEEELSESLSVEKFSDFIENKNVQDLILYVDNNKFERANVKEFLIKLESFYVEEFKRCGINKFLQLSSIVRKYHLYLNRPVSVNNNLLLMLLEIKDCYG